MNENKENQNAASTQPEDNGAQNVDSGRTFTQEEVNNIVADRLARERSKAAKTQQTEAYARDADLTARENRLICKEFLLDNDYPAELLDTIDTSNPEEFKSKAKTAFDAITSKRTFTPSPQYSAEPVVGSGMSAAFAPDVKHKPRDYHAGYGGI